MAFVIVRLKYAGYNCVTYRTQTDIIRAVFWLLSLYYLQFFYLAFAFAELHSYTWPDVGFFYLQRQYFLPRDICGTEIARCPPVCPSVCDVGGSGSHRLKIL